MSIYFDFDVGPSGRKFRRAVDGDKSDIELIWNRNHTENLFGVVDIGSLIELSVLSICMINENKDIVGFIAFNDYPNVPAVDPADWEVWVRNMYQKFYMSRNTLFIHFMCCKDSVTEYFLEEALISVFLNDSYLLHLIIFVPYRCSKANIMRYRTFKKRNVYKFCPKRENAEEHISYLYVALRQEFVPKLKIRAAMEEDNDDIVEILDKKCPRLKELYGEYYISEIIGRHPGSNRKIIVIDYRDRVAGVMCLNSEINYKMLQSTYELHAFFGLKKATPLEKEHKKRCNILRNIFAEPIINGKWSPFDHVAKLEKQPVSSEKCEEPEYENTPPVTKNSSKVSFSELNNNIKLNTERVYFKRDHSDDYSEKGYMASPTPSQGTVLSAVDYLLEDDPFDYEIVNIDSHLLTVPDVMSLDIIPEEINSLPRRSRVSIMQNKMKKRTSMFLKPKPPVENPNSENVMYRGSSNAFMIELFGMREDIDERQAFDLLEVAFETMKTYDYCLIHLPCKDKFFPLLHHFCFVPTKAKVCSDYALYIAHRSSVLGKLRVRKAEIVDLPQITQLMHNLDSKETIWSIENDLTEHVNHDTYVFVSGISLIGVGILEPPEQLDFIRAKFNLDTFQNHKYHNTGQGVTKGFATIKFLLMYPLFEAHYRYFTRDMMRLSGKQSLIWLTAYRNKWVAHKANTLVSAMVPLLPRQSEIDCTRVPELQRMNTLSKDTAAFSAWFISKKHTSITKVNIDTRIVAVGASRTAMAFLNTLIFGDSTYLTFTNVTLVSPYGLPYMRHHKSAPEGMFLRYRCHSDKYLKSVPYSYYVNIVQGTIMDIDKKAKHIKLSSGRKYNYDLLFLLYGKQYQHPEYLRSILERGKQIRSGNIPYVRLDVPRTVVDSDIETREQTPTNVFIINHLSEANKAIKYCTDEIYEKLSSGKIIVYGATLHAYCCLATLIESNFPFESIVFVEPFPPEDPKKPRIPVFCNVNVDQTVREVLNNIGIKVYRSYYFESWRLNTSTNLATHVEFISQYKLLRLECCAFFYYGKRGVNARAFYAINKSGMPYDGGILIDHQFRTKDPSIYAAGPATRYNRRYYSGSKRHKFYDSSEVGEKLGTQIKDFLDPVFSKTTERKTNISEGSGENSARDSQSSKITCDQNFEALPDLRKPVVIHCTLPGSLQYLEVRPPGRKIPHYYVQSLDHNGFVMETFKKGYFKLHVNNDLVIDGITCLTPEKYSLENFKNLYGRSVVVMNNVHLRYTAKKVDDFYDFFRSPWALFLYHDQVDELFAMAKELLPLGQYKGETLADALRAIGNVTSPHHTRMKIYSILEKSPHVEAITEYVMEWLIENDILLPMYYKRSQRVEFSHDLDRNPAFKKNRRSLIKLLKKIF